MCRMRLLLHLAIQVVKTDKCMLETLCLHILKLRTGGITEQILIVRAVKADLLI